MKINVLKSIIKERTVEVLELKKEDIPLPDILKYGMCDIELIMEEPVNDFFGEILFYDLKRKSGLPEFTINMYGKAKRIKGIIFAASREDAVEFLSKYYVEGDSVIDSCIKLAPTKKEGIQRAFLSYPEDIEIVIFEFEELFLDRLRAIKMVRYRDFYVCSMDYEFERVVLTRNKFIKVKKYKIPRTEYLIFFTKRKNKILRRKGFIRSFIHRRNHRKKTSDIEVEKCLYYDGREFSFPESISSKIVLGFEKYGNMILVAPDVFGYNFLKFRAFVPWKKSLRRKISKKRIKNPFGVPAVFAFDSRIPVNLPQRVRIIDDEETIYAFNYIRRKKKAPFDFPIVYFHPSVKEDTEFLLIASL